MSEHFRNVVGEWLGKTHRLRLGIFIVIAMLIPVDAAEVLLADYFDIRTGSVAGTKVSGKVNLFRNKDVPGQAVPADFALAIVADPSGVFELSNERDAQGRLFGEISVKAGHNISETPQEYQLSIELRQGAEVLAAVPVTIKAVAQTLQEIMQTYAMQHCKIQDRLFARARYNDATVTALITEVEENGGKFLGYDFYTRPVTDYYNTVSTMSPNLSAQWQAVEAKIGGLGYAYVNPNSALYGPNGSPTQRLRLKNAIYLALNTFIDRIPFDPAQVVKDGVAIGTDMGDGLFRLNEKFAITHTDITHQWIWTDPLTGPVVWILPELLQEAESGDAAAQALHEKILGFFQLSFGGPKNTYRNLTWPWGPIADPNHSAGAFSDGNIPHRARGWLALPAIWNDYNRPITYLPYWYENYYPNGVTLMPGWTPRGVLNDYLFWLKSAYRETHLYGLGGFHPDGTVSHHLFGNTQGIAMHGYGYEWLVSPLYGLKMLQNSGIDLGSDLHNFMAKHLRKSWGIFAYRGEFDYTMAGIDYLSDLRALVNFFANDTVRLLDTKQATTVIEDEAGLSAWRQSIVSGTHAETGNFPFWVSLSMVQRRAGETSNPASHYFSVKMGNDRVSTADDSYAYGKAYHTGSGILQMRVLGNEYDRDARRMMDWHALPGLTEEWRTDAIPKTFVDRAAGGSAYAGMASDGEVGFSHMRYRPMSNETYCGAQADKGYYFTGNEAIALGCNIVRRAAGQGRNIITTLDQTRWNSDLTYSLNGAAAVTVAKDSSIDQNIALTGPTWLHQGNAGYIIFPQESQSLVIRGGAAVVPTDPTTPTSAKLIHIAIDHGIDPQNAKYYYILVPNVTAAEMPAKVSDYQQRIEIVANGGIAQGIYDKQTQLLQVAFHQAGEVSTTEGMSLSADRVAMVQCRRVGQEWKLSVSDPIHELNASSIQLRWNAAVRSGLYEHTLPGINPMPGEAVEVRQAPDEQVTIRVPLTDPTDDARLEYKAELYAHVPIRVTLPVNEPLNLQNKSLIGQEDTELTIEPLADQGFENPSSMHIREISEPLHGTVVQDGGSLRYQPDEDWSGRDQFDFVVIDEAGNSSLATILINIEPINDVPEFTQSTISLPNAIVGEEYTGQNLRDHVRDSDIGDELSFSKISGPEWLIIETNGQISGTPGPNDGAGEWVVQVTDFYGATAQATLRLLVRPGSRWSAWQNRDIQANGQAGDLQVNELSASIQANGSGLGGAADSVHFVWQELQGDGEIRARLTSLTSGSGSALAGLMLRESDTVGAKTIALGIHQSSGFQLAYRDQTDGPIAQANVTSANAETNRWLSLIRRGQVVTAYHSADGLTWTETGSVTVALNRTLFAGLMVTSGEPTQRANAVFDQVQIRVFAQGDPRLIRHWKLDEIRDGKVWESVSQSLDGTVVSGSMQTSGKIGNTVYLGGLGSSISGSTLGISSNNMTIAGWIKRNGSQINYTGLVFSRSHASGGVISGFHLGTAHDLCYTWNADANTTAWSSGLIVPDQTWTFVALSLSPNRVTIYQKVGNDLQSASREYAHSVENFTSAQQRLGSDFLTGNRSFKGWMDEIRIYNEALPVEEIAWLSEQNAPRNEAATYWDQDGGGLEDDWEVQYFSVIGQPASGDADEDGLTNEEERLAGTHPLLADSDWDGTPDLAELRLGLDALNPQEHFDLSILTGDTGRTISWPSQADCYFRLEKSDDLSSWSVIHPLLQGEASQTNFVPTNSSMETKAFYRAILLKN